jgi:hypothetical protein
MNEETIAWLILGVSFLWAIIYLFQDTPLVQALTRVWVAIKQAIIDLFTALSQPRKASTWAKYKTKLARDARKNLSYLEIRLMEYECYDGKVFHQKNGTCEIEPFVPYEHNTESFRYRMMQYEAAKISMLIL